MFYSVNSCWIEGTVLWGNLSKEHSAFLCVAYLSSDICIFKLNLVFLRCMYFYSISFPFFFCPIGISSKGNFPREGQQWQRCATQPILHAGCFSISIIHQTLTWITGSLTCAQMLTHATACGGVWTHVRVYTESWYWEKNVLPHRWMEPESEVLVCRSDTLPTELHPHLITCVYFYNPGTDC